MTQGLREAERTFLAEFIDLYRDMTPLWQPRCVDYMDRFKRQECYELLLSKYQERYPDASMDCLKRRINTLRTNFRKELKKVKKAEKNGKKNVNTAWHFKHLAFLGDEEEGNGLDDSAVADHDQSPVKEEPTPHTLRKRPLLSSDGRSDPEEAIKRPKLDEDSFYLAKTWASELKGMAPSQRLLARKFINDILFEGQLGNLNRHSVLISSGMAAGPGLPVNCLGMMQEVEHISEEEEAEEFCAEEDEVPEEEVPEDADEECSNHS